jgi:hypothetical protein
MFINMESRWSGPYREAKMSLHGQADGKSKVGYADMQYGVWGEADQETGVIGTSNSQVRSGVFGWSDENTGVYGTSMMFPK